VKWGPVVGGDIHDEDQVVRAIDDHKTVAVLHFAASSQVGESVSEPEKYYRNNVEGTLSLLRAMRQTACKTVVFSSSGAVYGNARSGLINEREPPQPTSPYGRTKLIIEQILHDFQNAYAFNHVCLRYFNASGADLRAEIGENHSPETHLIPRALLALQGKVDDFAIFGDDYNTPDGTAIRDYIHVADLAHAHLLALQYLLSGKPSGCFNLGTGHGHSVREILDQISGVTGRKLDVSVKPRRPGDPAVLVADPTNAKTILGFRPRYSDLRTIVSSAWKWHRSDASDQPADRNLRRDSAALERSIY
jgi:UDP-glucose-4-epimerase GalE